MAQSKDPKDPLDALLDRFSAPPAPRSLKSEVWRRIEQSETPAEGTTWFEWLQGALARPTVAVLFVACCLFLGLFLAEVRVSRLEHDRSVQLARGYLQLVDPILRAETGGGR